MHLEYHLSDLPPYKSPNVSSLREIRSSSSEELTETLGIAPNCSARISYIFFVGPVSLGASYLE